MKYSIIDPESWVRKEQYLFFTTFDQPFTGLVTDVDVTKAYQTCKSQQLSFFLFYLHKSICAINDTPAFRLRIADGELREYSVIHASATIMRANRTFGFSYIPMDRNFEQFSANAKEEITRIQNDATLFPPINDVDVIHYSAVPWIRFTGLEHATHNQKADSVPKISFGKIFKDHNDQWMMPISIHAHHGLVDGIDIADYLNRFQELLDEG